MSTATTPGYTESQIVVRHPKRRLPAWSAVGVSIALLSVCGFAYWYLAIQTYHLGTVARGILYRDGNRDLREFQHAIARQKIKTVVSLIDDRELTDPTKTQFRAETDLCIRAGIRQVRIPVPLGGWPTSADLQKFLAIVTDPSNQPVLVHCAQGVRRTGMFVAGYEMSVENLSPARTKAAIQSFGHKPTDLVDVDTFIDRYDPVRRSLPTTLPSVSHE